MWVFLMSPTTWFPWMYERLYENSRPAEPRDWILVVALGLGLPIITAIGRAIENRNGKKKVLK